MEEVKILKQFLAANKITSQQVWAIMMDQYVKKNLFYYKKGSKVYRETELGNNQMQIIGLPIHN